MTIARSRIISALRLGTQASSAVTVLMIQRSVVGTRAYVVAAVVLAALGAVTAASVIALQDAVLSVTLVRVAPAGRARRYAHVRRSN